MTSPGRIAVFQHASTEGPGAAASWLADRGYELLPVEWWRGGVLHDPESLQGCLVLGGAMNIYQYRSHPWLREEMRTLEKLADRGVPILGICLGAQLLADLLGARTTENPHHEIGWWPVEFSQQAREVFPRLPAEGTFMHWHGDTFELPAGAVRLASSRGCAEQGFLYRDHLLGLQFHPEVDAAMLGDFCPDNEHLWPRGEFVQSRSAILQKAPGHFPEGHRTLEVFLDHLFGKSAGSPSPDHASVQQPGLDLILDSALQRLESANLRRSLRVIDGPQGPTGFLEGKEVINFASNDYLGLAGEEFLREAFREACGRFGVGSGASRLISGTQPPHRQLEEALADFKQTEAALAFSCGFSAALGTLSALMGSGDVILLDKLSHACLVDGARLSGATIRVFPHNNLDKLESHLRWARKKFPRGRILVVTESVFSMDGDLAPLAEIVELKETHGAWLMVDEAHGIGVLGNEGRGLIDALGLAGRVEIQMGTLGKALGAAGGAIAGSRALVDFLVNKARSLIFSTAPPAAQAAAARAAIEWLPTPEGKARMAALDDNRRRMASLCEPLLPGVPPSAIIPIPVGSEKSALELAGRCLDAGVWIPAVRYPTVPRAKARLRLTLTAKHTPGHLEKAAALVCQTAKSE